MGEIAPELRSQMMRSIRKKNTRPELEVRRVLRRLGFGYRLHAADLPGNPDIIFRTRRKAIFVHGCFWHQHPGCHLAKKPSARPEYWLPKLARNVERDRAAVAALEALGWKTLVVWECEVSQEEKLRGLLEGLLGGEG